MLYQLTLTPLTPIHIGAGTAIEPYEYVVAGDRLIKFHPERFIAALSREEEDKFLELSMKDILGMREFVREKIKILKDISIREYSFEVSRNAVVLYESRLKEPRSDLSVYPCLKTGGTAFMPGSSLKGAIRTALLYDKVTKPVADTDAKKIEAETFGYSYRKDGRYVRPDIAKDPFKNLKIGDSQKSENSTILRTITVHTKTAKGWREDVPLLREVTLSRLHDNASLFFTHILQVVDDARKGEKDITPMDVVRSCKNFYSRHLKEELEYFSSFPDAYHWYNALRKYNDALPENGFLVRIGWGSGFDGVTINYARSYRERKKSRRLSEGCIPLGWAEVILKKTGGKT